MAYLNRRSDRPLAALTVRAAPGRPSRGWLIAGRQAIPVALGRGGIRANKFEGDGGTPRGTFHPLKLWWRADRWPRPRTHLPIRRITARDAWCEDPTDRHYNQAVRRAPSEAGDRLRAWTGADVTFPELNGAQRQRRMIDAGASPAEVYAASVRETQATYLQEEERVP